MDRHVHWPQHRSQAPQIPMREHRNASSTEVLSNRAVEKMNMWLFGELRARELYQAEILLFCPWKGMAC